MNISSLSGLPDGAAPGPCRAAAPPSPTSEMAGGASALLPDPVAAALLQGDAATARGGGGRRRARGGRRSQVGSQAADFVSVVAPAAVHFFSRCDGRLRQVRLCGARWSCSAGVGGCGWEASVAEIGRQQAASGGQQWISQTLGLSCPTTSTLTHKHGKAMEIKIYV